MLIIQYKKNCTNGNQTKEKAAVQNKKVTLQKKKAPVRKKVAVKKKVKPVLKKKPNKQVKKIVIDKERTYKIDAIKSHKMGKIHSDKVTTLLILWDGSKQTTWESLKTINATASGLVKDYLKSESLSACN